MEFTVFWDKTQEIRHRQIHAGVPKVFHLYPRTDNESRSERQD